MEKDQRQKNVARACSLDMCGSRACAIIRSIDSGDLEPQKRLLYDGTYEFHHGAWKPLAFTIEPDCHAKCGLQAVCTRLEMDLRLRDLDELSVIIDSGAYSRHERMGVCDAWTYDNEDETMAVGAGGICSDYHNECDDTWDSMGDPCMELWAGDPGVGFGGTGLVHFQEIGWWNVPQPNTAEKYIFEKLDKILLSDWKQSMERMEKYMMGDRWE